LELKVYGVCAAMFMTGLSSLLMIIGYIKTLPEMNEAYFMPNSETFRDWGH